MRNLLRQLRAAAVVLLFLACVAVVIHPACVTLVATQAGGGRPAPAPATSETDKIGQGEFVGRAAAGSLLPSDAEARRRVLDREVGQRARMFRIANGLPADAILPPDSVLVPACPVDPAISPGNALVQAGRVARVRGLSAEVVRAEIERHAEPRWLGVLGEPAVDVGTLNSALDAAAQQP